MSIDKQQQLIRFINNILSLDRVYLGVFSLELDQYVISDRDAAFMLFVGLFSFNLGYFLFFSIFPLVFVSPNFSFHEGILHHSMNANSIKREWLGFSFLNRIC